MCAEIRKRAWAQTELIPEGYDQIIVEFTVHLDAVKDQLVVGAALLETGTREWIALEAFAIHCSLLESNKAAWWMDEVMKEAIGRMVPFV